MILIVDYDPGLRGVFQIVLRTIGFDVSVASTAAQTSQGAHRRRSCYIFSIMLRNYVKSLFSARARNLVIMMEQHPK
jgi:DNA-binding response OmpR family regulator